jgi:hypothetical protein
MIATFVLNQTFLSGDYGSGGGCLEKSKNRENEEKQHIYLGNRLPRSIWRQKITEKDKKGVARFKVPDILTARSNRA